MPRQFRSVFASASALRLQRRPTDPAMTWNFPWDIDGEGVHVLVRDRIDATAGYARHVGLEIQIELSADDLDAALERAHRLASLHLTLLSVVGRGPIAAPQPVLIYETTPGTEDRGFRQWHQQLPLPTGKTPVPAVRSFLRRVFGNRRSVARVPRRDGDATARRGSSGG
jgi:hypothetical protein